MASAVADLEAGLQAMLNLKPPGVSGSRITSLTALCVANIQVRFLHHYQPRERAQMIRIVTTSSHMLTDHVFFSPNPFSSRKSTPTSRRHLEHTSWASYTS
jgi:glutamate-1-semialdehyde aminotransferase